MVDFFGISFGLRGVALDPDGPSIANIRPSKAFEFPASLNRTDFAALDWPGRDDFAKLLISSSSISLDGAFLSLGVLFMVSLDLTSVEIQLLFVKRYL